MAMHREQQKRALGLENNQQAVNPSHALTKEGVVLKKGDKMIQDEQIVTEKKEYVPHPTVPGMDIERKITTTDNITKTKELLPNPQAPEKTHFTRVVEEHPTKRGKVVEKENPLHHETAVHQVR